MITTCFVGYMITFVVLPVNIGIIDKSDRINMCIKSTQILAIRFATWVDQNRHSQSAPLLAHNLPAASLSFQWEVKLLTFIQKGKIKAPLGILPTRSFYYYILTFSEDTYTSTPPARRFSTASRGVFQSVTNLVTLSIEQIKFVAVTPNLL